MSMDRQPHFRFTDAAPAMNQGSASLVSNKEGAGNFNEIPVM